MGLNAREINFFSRIVVAQSMYAQKYTRVPAWTSTTREGDEKSEKEKNENRAQYDLIIFSRYVAIMSASRLAKY